MVILMDREDRKFGAFVEIDLGSMSHTRLRQKAELYAAYAASDAWRDRHLFSPRCCSSRPPMPARPSS
jgi:hypothetical protein